MSTNELLPSSAPGNSREFDEWIIERATAFSTVLFTGRGQKDRREWATLQEAINWALPNPRIMVYAAMGSGRACMVPPAQYDRALAIVGSFA